MALGNRERIFLSRSAEAISPSRTKALSVRLTRLIVSSLEIPQLSPR
jgi:hypothetical protein